MTSFSNAFITNEVIATGLKSQRPLGDQKKKDQATRKKSQNLLLLVGTLKHKVQNKTELVCTVFEKVTRDIVM